MTCKFEIEKIALSVTIEDHVNWSEYGGTRAVTSVRGSMESGGEAEADHNELVAVLGVRCQELMRARNPWVIVGGE